jgi:hypothetical protein
MGEGLAKLDPELQKRRCSKCQVVNGSRSIFEGPGTKPKEL